MTIQLLIIRALVEIKVILKIVGAVDSEEVKTVQAEVNTVEAEVVTKKTSLSLQETEVDGSEVHLVEVKETFKEVEVVMK